MVKSVEMVPVLFFQPVAWKKSVGLSLPALAREKYQSNTLLYAYIVLAEFTKYCFSNSLTSSQSESQLKR